MVVGGGPTGVEFAGTLADFLREDLRKKYPALMKHVRVTLLQVGAGRGRGCCAWIWAAGAQEQYPVVELQHQRQSQALTHRLSMPRAWEANIIE